ILKTCRKPRKQKQAHESESELFQLTHHSIAYQCHHRLLVSSAFISVILSVNEGSRCPIRETPHRRSE
ncbi:MAG TPA: hypothetical protein VE843_02410, partial [Ktedonobacteraceae bacterium]|nr:hypothetical protein [Ktedonobacteraceae bacterium]